MTVQPTRDDEYEAFLEHRGSCDVCQRTVLVPLPLPSELVYLLADLSACPEGLNLARACVIVPFDPDTLAAIPFVAASGSNPALPVVAVGPGQSVDLLTNPVSWASFRLVGFRTRIYHHQTNLIEAEARRLLGIEDIVTVTDLTIGGSPNLFWHEGFADLQAYGAGRPLQKLRQNPILRAPNQAFVTLYRPPETSVDAPLHVACELVVEPLSEGDFFGNSRGLLARTYGVHEIRRRIRTATDALLNGIEVAALELEAIGGDEPTDTDPQSVPF